MGHGQVGQRDEVRRGSASTFKRQATNLTQLLEAIRATVYGECGARKGSDRKEEERKTQMGPLVDESVFQRKIRWGVKTLMDDGS